jgi:hypothetical protein
MKNRASRVLVLGLITAALLTASPVLAQGPDQGETLKDRAGPASISAPPRSPYINIRVDEIPNLSPAVAYNSRHAEFLVVWEEHIHGNYIAIYGRRVGLDAGTIGPAFPIAAGDGYQYTRPDVAYSPREDQYLVSWMYKYGTEDYDVWARPVGWDGTLGSIIAIDTDLDRDWYPAVAYNSHDNEFLVVYEKYIGETRRDIEAQRVRASDWSLASWRNLAGGTDEIRRLPDVAYNQARNEYLISYVFQTPPMPPLAGDIVARRSSSNMGWLSSEYYLTTTGYPPQTSISVVAGSDEFLAAWDEDHGTDQDSVWARRVSGGGGPQPFINIAHITDRHNFESAVAYGDGGHYLIVWRTVLGVQPDWDWNIAGRLVSRGDNQPEGPIFAVDETSCMQKNPDVACSAAGPCLVVYEDDWPCGTNDYEIRGVLLGHRRVFLPLTLRR